jgi:hypothetical protein
VQHRLIREALLELDFRTPQIEITTLADIRQERVSARRAVSRQRS